MSDMSSRWRRVLVGVAIGTLLAPVVAWIVGRQDVEDPGDLDLLVVPAAWPAADNAYHWMEQVQAAWPLDADEDVLIGRMERGEVPWEDARAAELLAKLAVVRPHVDRALACSHAVSSLQSSNAGVWRCRALLPFEADVHYRAGRTDGAIRAATDAVALGSLILRGSLSHGLQYHDGAVLRREGVAALRRIGARTPPDAELLDGVVRRLAAWEVAPSAWVQLAVADYSRCVRELSTMAAGGPVPAELAPAVPRVSAGYWLHPNATRQLLQVSLRRMIAEPAKPLRERFVPSRVIVIPNPLEGFGARVSPNWVGRVFAELTDPGYRGFLPEAAAKDEAELSATRVLLALVAHRHRAGRLPDTLEPLLPVLGSIPRDPYDGAPIRYDAARRLVWVVGTNPKDEQGSPQRWDDERASSGVDSRWENADPAWQLPE